MTKHAAIVGVRVGDEGKGVRVVHYAQRMMKQGSTCANVSLAWSS